MRMRQTDILTNNNTRYHIGALSLKSIEPNILADSFMRGTKCYRDKLYRQTHTMSKLVEKYVIPLKHKKCGYQWNYGGKRPYYATCPCCRNQVNIRKNVIGSEQVLGGASAHSISATTRGVNR